MQVQEGCMMSQLISLKTMQRGLGFFNVAALIQNFGEETIIAQLHEKRRTHGLFYVNCAKITVTLPNGRIFHFTRHNLFYIPKYLKYSIIFSETEENEFSDIQVTFNLYAPNDIEYFLSEVPLLLLEKTPTKVIHNMLQIADYTINQTYPTFPINRAFSSMMETVSNHLWLPELSNIEKSRIFPSICYLDKHINEKIPVSQLAKLCLMNETKFRQMFKRDTGKTPAQYRIEKKIEKAQELLVFNPSISSSELVALLGFSDTSYFYKTFYAVTNMTLRTFRKNLKNN